MRLNLWVVACVAAIGALPESAAAQTPCTSPDKINCTWSNDYGGWVAGTWSKPISNEEREADKRRAALEQRAREEREERMRPLPCWNGTVVPAYACPSDRQRPISAAERWSQANQGVLTDWRARRGLPSSHLSRFLALQKLREEAVAAAYVALMTDGWGEQANFWTYEVAVGTWEQMHEARAQGRWLKAEQLANAAGELFYWCASRSDGRCTAFLYIWSIGAGGGPPQLVERFDYARERYAQVGQGAFGQHNLPDLRTREEEIRAAVETARRTAPAEFAASRKQWASESFGAGLDLMLAGQFAEAVEPYREALELDPSNLGYRGLLAHTLRRAGRHPEALTEWQKVVEAEPRNGWHLLAVAETQGGAGRLDEAMKTLDRAAALKLPQDTVPFYRELIRGRAEMARSDYIAAIPHLQRATELQAGDAGSRMELGEALMLAGLRVPALAAAEKAVALAPEDRWLRARYDKLRSTP